jgi:hypothetical protein
MEKKTLRIGGVCVSLLLVLGLVLGLTLTRDSGDSLKDETLDTINRETRFPNGSTVLQISSINPLDDYFKPNNVTKKQLQEWGIKVILLLCYLA